MNFVFVEILFKTILHGATRRDATWHKTLSRRTKHMYRTNGSEKKIKRNRKRGELGT